MPTLTPKFLKKLKLHGFNNLTKALSFNIYDVCYAPTTAARDEYIKYIDEVYNAERLTEIMSEVSRIIGATILDISRQDYDPQGASVTMLISEEPMLNREGVVDAEAPGPSPQMVLAHLDKSHITAHTYPESHPGGGISTFRADIDVSTCGRISPLLALNYLIHSFESDIVIMDYRVRGFTRDVKGRKHYIDHQIHSIQNYIDKKTRDRCQMVDVNVYQENLFHTKMMRKDLVLDDYLFGAKAAEIPLPEQARITRDLERELVEIYYGRNLGE